jgi:hypothetical protein
MRPRFLSQSYTNNNTRQYPRTMQQAFGPYTDRQLQPMRDNERSWRLSDGVIAAILVAVIVGLCVGVL